MYKQHNRKHRAKHLKNENKIVNKISNKLTAAKAIVTKTDKGNSMIILPETDYNNKVHNFVDKNNVTHVPQDNTKTTTHRKDRHQRM